MEFYRLWTIHESKQPKQHGAKKPDFKPTASYYGPFSKPSRENLDISRHFILARQAIAPNQRGLEQSINGKPFHIGENWKTSRRNDFSSRYWNNTLRRNSFPLRENDFPSCKIPATGGKNGRNRLKTIDLARKLAKKGKVRADAGICIHPIPIVADDGVGMIPSKRLRLRETNPDDIVGQGCNCKRALIAVKEEHMAVLGRTGHGAER